MYRLVNGVFRAQSSNDEIRKQMELEEERKKKQEEIEEESDVLAFDSLSSNLNSKKSLQMALKDKRTIASISHLKLVMNIAMICLIILGTVDYTMITSAFNDINSNFNLIEQSYARVSQIERTAFNLRTLIMANEGLLSVQDTQYIASGTDFIGFLT